MQIIVNTLISAGYYSLMAVGFGLFFRAFRYVDFSLGILVAAAGYIAYALLDGLHVGLWLTSLIATLAGVSIAAILYCFISISLNRRRVSPAALMLASLGVYILIQNVISLGWGDATRTVDLGTLNRRLSICGAGLTTIQVAVVVVPCLWTLGLVGLVCLTQLGRRIRCVISDASLSQVVGIQVAQIRVVIVLLSAVGASLSGVLYSFDVGISPHMGLQPLLMGIVASILGQNTIVGSFLGSLFLALAQQLVGMWLEIKWQDALTFAVLVIALLVQLNNRSLKKQESPWITGYTS